MEPALDPAMSTSAGAWYMMFITRAIVCAIFGAAAWYAFRSRGMEGGVSRVKIGEICLSAVVSFVFGPLVTFTLQGAPLLPYGLLAPGSPWQSMVRSSDSTCNEPVYQRVTCEILLLPRHGRAKVSVPWSEIRIWDDAGHEYTPAEAAFGRGVSTGGQLLEATLADGVSELLEVTFSGLDQEAREISRIEIPIRFEDGSTEWLKVSSIKIRS